MFSDILKTVTDGTSSAITALMSALTPLIVKYGVMSIPPVFIIHVFMVLIKSATHGLIKRTKFHDLIYTTLPLAIGILYTESVKLIFGQLDLSHPKAIVMGIVFGGLNVVAYKIYKKIKNRKDIKDEVKELVKEVIIKKTSHKKNPK